MNRHKYASGNNVDRSYLYCPKCKEFRYGNVHACAEWVGTMPQRVDVEVQPLEVGELQRRSRAIEAHIQSHQRSYPRIIESMHEAREIFGPQ